MGMVLMSKRELNRLDVLARLDRGRLTARAAAELMTITPRQTYRLLRRYRDGGVSTIANQRRAASLERSLAGCGSRSSANFSRTQSVQNLLQSVLCSKPEI